MGASGGRRTKIVATIGPRSDSPETLLELIRAGMNVARLNFSHGSPSYHHPPYDAVLMARSE